MSGPVLAGLVALVYDAYRQNHPEGEWPDPIDVINTVEATATATREDHGSGEVWDQWAHRTYTIGAGFADVRAAVRLAEDAGAGVTASLPDFADVTLADEAISIFDGTDDGAEFSFSVAGDRSDDGVVFTAGQTVQVDLTVDANAPATVRDRIPFDWTVEGGDDHTVYTEDGTRYIEFDDVRATADAEESATRTYLLEAPDSSGTYTFGPAEAAPAEAAGTFRDFTGSETNRVVGVDQNDAPL